MPKVQKIQRLEIRIKNMKNTEITESLKSKELKVREGETQEIQRHVGVVFNWHEGASKDTISSIVASSKTAT